MELIWNMDVIKMGIVNEELSILQKKKHALIRQLNRKEITQEDYDVQMLPITTQINEKLGKILNKTGDTITLIIDKPSLEQNQAIQPDKKLNEEEIEMAEEKEAKKPKVESYTQLIIKALMAKSLKTIDAVAEKVLEWRPGRDIKRVKSQIHSIIGLVKKQDPKQAKRWLNYEWKEDEYLLVQKTP